MAGITNVQWQLQADNSDLVRELKEARAELANLNKTFGNVEKSAKEAGDAGVKSMDKIEKETKQAAQSTNSLANNLKNVAAAAAAFAAANILGGFGKSIIDITAQFQKFKAVLTNTLGSEGAAINSLQLIQDFAAKTPFSVAELTDSFVKLVNSGFKPTEKELTSLGDLAASKGKQLDQLTEAIIDSQTGEFERLKEFGIKASKEGDKVTFTFKGIKTQVDFTQKSIEKYILSLGNMKGVSGSMAAISATLGGKISNLGDTFDSLLLKLGDAFLPVIDAVLDVMSDLIGWVKENTSGIKAFAQGLADAIKFVAGYGKELLLIIQATALYAGAFKAATIVVGLFAAGTTAATVALQRLYTTFIASPIGAFAVSVTAVILLIKELISVNEDFINSQKDSIKALKDTTAALDEYSKHIDEIVFSEKIAKLPEATRKALKEQRDILLKAEAELEKINLIARGEEIPFEARTETELNKLIEIEKKKNKELTKISEEDFNREKNDLADFIKANDKRIFEAERVIKGSAGAIEKAKANEDFDITFGLFGDFGLAEINKNVANAKIEINKAVVANERAIKKFSLLELDPTKISAGAKKAVKDTAKAINEHVKALETLSGAIKKDAEKQALATAELQRADVQNLIDLQIEKDQIERDYTLGKFDREKAVFEQEQKIEKAEFDIEKNNQIKEANDRIKRDQEEIQRRIDARDTAFVVAIAKEKDNLTKLSGEQRELQQKKIEQLEAERQVAVQTGNAEIDRIRKEGAILIENSQKNIDKKELDLLKVQGDAKKALTEKQEKERGELILKLNNDIFAAENALAKTNFEAESIFHIADLKKFSTYRERLEKEHLERLRKIDEEEAAKKDDLQSKGEEFTTKIQREFQLKREKETREHQTNINKSWREQIVTVIDAFTQGLKIFQELFDTFANISKERLQKVIDERGKKIDEINERADNGERISVEQLRIEEERRARAAEEQKRIAEQQIAIAQAVATANAIAAIAKAALEGGGIASVFTIAATVAALVAGYAAAAGATQAATPPLLAEGGVISNGKILHPNKNTILEGKSHKEGGMLIEAEHGEAFISKENTKKYQEPINAIMAGTFEEFASKYTLPRPVNYDARLFNEMVSQLSRNQVDMGGVESRLDSLEKTFSNSIKQIPSTYVKITEGGLETTVSKVQIDKEIAQNRAKF